MNDIKNHTHKSIYIRDPKTIQGFEIDIDHEDFFYKTCNIKCQGFYVRQNALKQKQRKDWKFIFQFKKYYKTRNNPTILSIVGLLDYKKEILETY